MEHKKNERLKHFTKEKNLNDHFPLAFEEDGGQNPEVPGPQRWDLRHPEQVHEVWRRREHAGGTCPLLPATDPPVARQQLKCCCSADHFWEQNTDTILHFL